MAKYEPESRGKIEHRVTDLGYKAKDCIRHMGRTVTDANTIFDASRNMRSAATIEGAKEIKKYLLQAGKAALEKFNQQQKPLEMIIRQETYIVNELGNRTRDSKANYKQLTDASSSIKETSAARNLINQGRYVTLKDAYFMDNLREKTKKDKDRNRQSFSELGYKLKGTLLGIASNNLYRLHEVENAIDGMKGNIKNETVDLEGTVVSSDENRQNHDLCEPAKQRIGQLQDEIERLKNAGLPKNSKLPLSDPKHNYGSNYPNPSEGYNKRRS